MPDIESIIRTSVDAARDTFNDEAPSADEGDIVLEGETGDEGDTPITEEGDIAPLSEEGIQTSDKVVDPAIVADDPFAKEHGLKEPKVGERENRIPYTRVKKIVENAERKLVEKALGVPLAAGESVHEAITKHVARIPELEAKVKGQEAEIASSNTVLGIMETDVPRFLQMLTQVHPQYADYIKAPGQAEAEVPVTKPAGDMPPPDVDLGERGKTYSVEGLQKLLAWNAQQAREQTLAEVEKRYKPIADSHEAQQRINAAIPRLQKQIDYAGNNWKGFKDHEAAILGRLQADKTIPSLHDAYILVINEKHAEAVAAAEKRVADAEATVLARIKSAPQSTSTVLGTKPAVAATGPRSIEDTIRDAVRKHKAGMSAA